MNKRSDNFLHSSIRGLRLLFALKKGKMLLYILLAALHGLSWALQIIYLQKFFDAAELFAGKESKASQVLFALLFLAIVYLFSQVMNGVFNCFGQICSLSFEKECNRLIFERIGQSDLQTFEDTEKLEEIEKAQNGSKCLFWVSTTMLDIVFYYGTYFLTVGSYLLQQSPILGICIVVAFIPSILSRLLNIATFQKLEDDLAPLRRKTVYFEKCMTDKEYFKESRLLGAVPYFQQFYQKTLAILSRRTMKAQFRKGWLECLLSVLTVLCYGAVIFLSFFSVMNQSITAGSFAAILASMNRIYGFVNEVVTERFGWASENIAVAENFLTFLEITPFPKETRAVPEHPRIELRHVSFTYPNSAHKALDDISLTIENGQTIAVVGENGSGKTTLCRTIFGLYSPDEGTVTYNGVPADSVHWTGSSAVFQRFCRYKMTLRDNIRISDMEKNGTSQNRANQSSTGQVNAEQNGLEQGVTNQNNADQNAVDQEVRQLCAQCSVEIADAQDGRELCLDTMLGRDFGGAELSGGQWQRIAIARGLYRDSVLMILDEPTAAIDPLEEGKLYRDFAGISRDKTVLIVTHRLACAQIADRILVMKNGTILEDGSHQELLRANREYRRMYDMQSRWYQDI